MSDAVLEDYIGTLVEPRGERVVRALDRVIRSAAPELDCAIKYKILMYGLAGDFHTWVCAINSGRKRVYLNFLYGVMLDDPRRVCEAVPLC